MTGGGTALNAQEPAAGNGLAGALADWPWLAAQNRVMSLR